MEIKKDKKGMVVVQGAEIKYAKSGKDLYALFEEGSKSRHVASTSKYIMCFFCVNQCVNVNANVWSVFGNIKHTRFLSIHECQLWLRLFFTVRSAMFRFI